MSNRPRPATTGQPSFAYTCLCGAVVSYVLTADGLAWSFDALNTSRARGLDGVPPEIVAHLPECQSLSDADKALLRQGRGVDA